MTDAEEIKKLENLLIRCYVELIRLKRLQDGKVDKEIDEILDEIKVFYQGVGDV